MVSGPPQTKLTPGDSDHKVSPSQAARDINIPKNRSARNLAHPEAVERARLRFSLDASRSIEYESVLRPALMSEHEHPHGLGSSGLRRIRQQHSPRAGTAPTFDHDMILAAMNEKGLTSTPVSRLSSMSIPVSPTLAMGEDLSRFPSESLHSFSFAHQSEEVIHRRQGLLKKSIDFMRDKLGWAATNAGLAAAQAKVSGDAELQSMMELLSKANMVPGDVAQTPGLGLEFPTGPLTGPAGVDVDNIFEKSFQRCDSPEPLESEPPPPSLLTKAPEKEVSKEDGITMGRPPVKRNLTDIQTASLKTQLMEALAQPYNVTDTHKPEAASRSSLFVAGNHHSMHTRFTPAAQAIFTTEAKAPWTILAANDLACLVFGVTQSQIRKVGIMEVVREERREWLAERLNAAGSTSEQKHALTANPFKSSPNLARMGSGPQPHRGRRAKTGEMFASGKTNGRPRSGSRGVLLCGDVVPIQKRNGMTGSASLWVKEKRAGLIWVLEEINEHVAYLDVDEKGKITKFAGDHGAIWSSESVRPGADISTLIPHLPREDDGPVDYESLSDVNQYAAWIGEQMSLPCLIELTNERALRVSSFPHIAGIIVLSAVDLTIRSSNSVFSSALFGQSQANGLHITELIPDLDRVLEFLAEEDQIVLADGLVLPEHTFRRAWAMLALRDGKSDISSFLLRPSGLPARHRDGSQLQVDVQMRIVKNECAWDEEAIVEVDDVPESNPTELLYALWITYSRNLHSVKLEAEAETEGEREMHQPSPGQTAEVQYVEMNPPRTETPITEDKQLVTEVNVPVEPVKKTISDFVILEDMGQGAYGQVKLARYKKNGQKKVVLKYVTKRRILVDTWTRDRKLGTVPLEIHVLNYLRSDDLKHVNIVEMADFFEDETNYYIEMVPHGLPGMDLFDYIELRVNMDEVECRKIFRQVASAVDHLHNKAKVVHRDIKDENVILDGEGNIKLIDFGSAAYIRNGPFDVFVGTIDYAAPEVLAGKQYRGPEQDVWALGVLLYTIVYKENPFYNIDEIMDRDLRTPYIMSDNSIDIIRRMLDRDLENRITIGDVLQHPWTAHID